MITLENVNKIYSNGLHAVKDVNLKVNQHIKTFIQQYL